MSICLLMGFIPEKIKDEIYLNTKGIPQISADSLQRKYINGLSYYFREMTIINAPFVNYYPFKYRRKIVSAYEYTSIVNNCQVDVKSLSFRTTPFSYSKDRESLLYDELKHWIETREDEHTIIIIYSVHLPFMKACERIKKEYQYIKLIHIIPDFPEFMNSSSKLLSVLHHKISLLLTKRTCNRLYKIMDGFVYITKYMANYNKTFNKPYVIIEGIANGSKRISSSSSEKGKYIFYSGTMAEKYGIKLLVDAFLKIKHKDYELLLCGSGDSVDYITGLCNNKIKYLGVLDNEAVLAYQRNATLLVNPRTNEGEFVKYSFPSKILEYFSSGTPTLMYRLDGVPDDYYEFCFEAKSMSPEGLAQEIDRLLNKESEEIEVVGEKAAEFVQNKKSAKFQCNKIIHLIKAIANCESTPLYLQ